LQSGGNEKIENRTRFQYAHEAKKCRRPGLLDWQLVDDGKKTKYAGSEQKVKLQAIHVSSDKAVPLGQFADVKDILKESGESNI
jgi:hypothetical protein